MAQSFIRASRLLLAVAVMACAGASPAVTQTSSFAPTDAPTAAPSPTSTPTVPATAPPSTTPRPITTATSSSAARPALTESYTSGIHGISVAYPTGWHLQPATEPWTSGTVYQMSPFADVIYEKASDTAFIALASQPLEGQSVEQWGADYLAGVGDPCGTGHEPVTVDGATGIVDNVCHMALVSVEDRGYLIWLYRIPDRDYFEEILDTVQLRPEDSI